MQDAMTVVLCYQLPEIVQRAVIGGASPASVALHERAGFKHTGRMPATGFKFGKWVDTVLMQLELGEGAGTLPTEEPKLNKI